MSKSTKHPEITELSALKGMREKQNISIQTVADGMKVSKDLIHHIEAGNFDKLGAPTFLRGHITNYCKVVGHRPEQILSLIPAQYLQHQELKTSDAMGASPLARVRRQSNHFGRYAVGTALLGMLTLSFYFIWDKWSLPKRSLADTPVDLAMDADGSQTEKKITYSSLLPQVAGPNLIKSESNEQPVSEDASEEEGVLSDETGDDIQADDVEDQAVPDDTNNMAAVNQTSMQPAVLYSIKMQLEEQAWVSIKTLDGEQIVHDLIGPGVRVYQSDEPVHFRIGNAKKLQLLINEDPVELDQLITRDIADFEWPLNPS